MKTGCVVIGANFGDEGKGLLTDYFASDGSERSLVVRYNGGAQAGHTVVTPEGRRHVFSHFGAGTFAGCDTFLSQFFIVNPIVAVRECASLRNHGVRPLLFLDGAAFLTTPIDVFVNQAIERQRGNQRHGSCGLGINETVTRCLRDPKFRTRAHDMMLTKGQLFARLMTIARMWLPARLVELGIGGDEPQTGQRFASLEPILLQYVEEVEAMLDFSRIVDQPPSVSSYIFEGAQGLLLDEDRLEQWPHLTRSKTGLHNVVRLADKLGIKRLRVTYATRSYLTRHGAGPLEGECCMRFDDQTNIPNDFQGTLRFAPMDWGELNKRVELDLMQARLSAISVDAGLAITCCDQLEPRNLHELSIPSRYRVYGPSRADVVSLSSPARCAGIGCAGRE